MKHVKLFEGFLNENEPKTFREAGFSIVSYDKDDHIVKFKDKDIVFVDAPEEKRFKFGRPMEFESVEAANEFLDSKFYTSDEMYKRKSELSKKTNPSGKFAVYKMGGFSGNMTDENNHKQHGWHMFNFENEQDAIDFCIAGNYGLQLGNDGGGRYHVKEDDGTTTVAH